jgi:DNA-binding transcriptional ArsR family regulator
VAHARASPGERETRARVIVNQMANSAALDRTFAACAHPIRRGIIERLSEGELSVAQATHDFGVSKPAISKHLKVLEEAGAIVRVVDGRTHRLRIAEHALEDADGWMTRQRRMWERKLDVVEQYLREQRAHSREQAKPRKELM